MIELRTEQLLIRNPVDGDETGLVEFSEKNKDFLYPSGLIKLPDDLHTEKWIAFIKNSHIELKNETAVRFLVFHDDYGTVPIGKINYSQIFRGAFQACYLGYGMDKNFCGKGMMTKSLKITNTFMFDDFNIHRIMANYFPENVASARVLEKLGFVIESTAKDYLRINGVWRDHILTSLTNQNWIDT
jgi:[ribosomal protein S5]-alanine N-acetyltransferase